MRFLLCILFVWASFASFSQNVLVGSKNGRWLIYNEGSKIELPTNIYEVGNFDSKNLAFFGKENNYGFLNAKGDIVQQAIYSKIKQIGEGYYECLTDKGVYMIDFSAVNTQQKDCYKIESIDENWVILVGKENKELIHLETKLSIQLDTSTFVKNSAFNYVLLVENGQLRLYSPKGSELTLYDTLPEFRRNYFILRSKEKNALIFQNTEVLLPKNLTRIQVGEDEIIYSQPGETVVMDNKGNESLRVKYDALFRLNKNFYRSQKNNLFGVISNDGSEICKVEYRYITDYKTHYRIYKNNTVGIMSKDGKVLIPCQYQYILEDNDFYHLYSVLDFKGLYSKKKNKTILSPIFSKIRIGKDVIKAWTNKSLKIIELDSLHNVISSLILRNTIVFKEKTIRKSTELIDTRLFSLGWFYEVEPTLDSTGAVISSKNKWGLKGKNDTILIEAQLKQPKYIPHADFSLVYKGKIEYSHFGNGKVKTNVYGLRSHVTGRNLSPAQILSVDTLDLFTKSYTRFMSTGGPGYVSDNNKVELVHFMDRGNAKFTRFCSGKLASLQPATIADEDRLLVPSAFLNSKDLRGQTANFKNTSYNLIRYSKAEWNFLTPTGQKLFNETFQFVHPFYNNTAIVQRDSYWGVTREDSVIIPTEFASIKRIRQYGDTLFLVKKSPIGTRFLDTLSNDIDLKITHFIRKKDQLAQVGVGSTKKIMNGDYQVVSKELKSQKMLDGNFFYAKNKKEYELFNRTGEQLTTIPLKPVRIIFNDYILAKSRGKYGIIDFFGDTLVDFSYKKIETQGDYIFIIDDVNNQLFDKHFRLIKKCKTGRVMTDLVTGNFALTRNGHCTVFSSDGSKIKKFKNFSPDFFANNVLIKAGKSAIVHFLVGEIANSPVSIERCFTLGGFGYILHSRNGDSFYTEDWIKLETAETLHNSKYLGKGFVYSKIKGGRMILSKSHQLKLPADEKVVGKFTGAHLMIQSREDTYFINTELQNPFARRYKKAMPFADGYAAISNGLGWSIIAHDGLQKTLMTYSKIKPLGLNIFSTQKRPLYGVFDSHGKEILPVKFQRIAFLRIGIIQGVFEGEIFYYNEFGEEIVIE